MSENSNVFEVFTKLKKHSLKLVTVESMTAGLIASSFAEIPDASSVLFGGFVTYSPDAKSEFANVSLHTLNEFGIVSQETAKAMAFGGLKACENIESNENIISVSITGIAGPTGGTEKQPVGTVCIGVAFFKHSGVVYMEGKTFHLSGARNEIRHKAVDSVAGVIAGAIDKIVING